MSFNIATNNLLPKSDLSNTSEIFQRLRASSRPLDGAVLGVNWMVVMNSIEDDVGYVLTQVVRPTLDIGT